MSRKVARTSLASSSNTLTLNNQHKEKNQMKSDCNESQPCQGSDTRVDLESDLLDCTDEERREIILIHARNMRH